jgi:hypothetical protein
VITFFVSEAQLSKLIEDALISLKEIIATRESIAKKESETIEAAPEEATEEKSE